MLQRHFFVAVCFWSVFPPHLLTLPCLGVALWTGWLLLVSSALGEAQHNCPKMFSLHLNSSGAILSSPASQSPANVGPRIFNE